MEPPRALHRRVQTRDRRPRQRQVLRPTQLRARQRRARRLGDQVRVLDVAARDGHPAAGRVAAERAQRVGRGVGPAAAADAEPPGLRVGALDVWGGGGGGAPGVGGRGRGGCRAEQQCDAGWAGGDYEADYEFEGGGGGEFQESGLWGGELYLLTFLEGWCDADWRQIHFNLAGFPGITVGENAALATLKNFDKFWDQY